MRRLKQRGRPKRWPSNFLLALIPDLLIRNIPDWLLRVVDAPLVSPRWTLGPEGRISLRLATHMRRKMVLLEYPGICGTLANEGARSEIAGAILRATGMMKGQTDWYFIWRTPAGLDALVLELKSEDGRLSESQKDWKTLCDHWGIPHAVAYSYEEAIAALVNRGAIDG